REVREWILSFLSLPAVHLLLDKATADSRSGGRRRLHPLFSLDFSISSLLFFSGSSSVCGRNRRIKAVTECVLGLPRVMARMWIVGSEQEAPSSGSGSVSLLEGPMEWLSVAAFASLVAASAFVSLLCYVPTPFDESFLLFRLLMGASCSSASQVSEVLHCVSSAGSSSSVWILRSAACRLLELAASGVDFTGMAGPGLADPASPVPRLESSSGRSAVPQTVLRRSRHQSIRCGLLLT
ncbi:LOW QUALITY PROTEIN: hypothetical protein HID58_041757, partial [Brassica napus]